MAGGAAQAAPAAPPVSPADLPIGQTDWHAPLDLKPARWIWYPSGRTLQNTCVLFRREFDLAEAPTACSGWLLAESRYKLFVNGQYVQFGPAPADPRFSEADPLEAIRPHLRKGRNVIAVQALYFGVGEGTWPLGKPGLICNLAIATPAGETRILSDGSWSAHLARAWPPGQYKRWYLRALQEQRDERLFPRGWDRPDFRPDGSWLPAQVVEGAADKPALCNGYPEYQWEIQGDPADCALRRRSVAMLVETDVPVARLTESAWVRWRQPAEDYFDAVVPNAYETLPGPVADWRDGSCRVPVRKGQAAVLTFELPEQLVGWPAFEIDAPAGTIVELLNHEAHQVGGPTLINSHFNAWTRFICAEGLNRFETFDFESLRWLQLHVRNYDRPVTIRNVRVRRRELPWPKPAAIQIGDAKVAKVVGAAINTLRNACQETIVDGMGRERQQYAGDVSHQIHSLFQTYDEARLPGRFVNTFGQGMTLSGFFFDCWPAFDRLARFMERQLDLTQWGPLLDHSVGFGFDCWHYHLYSGDLAALKETFPRLLTFLEYLKSIRDGHGVLRVEDLGVPTVWIDHEAFRQQKHKQCAFTLYAAAMCEHALAPLARAMQLPAHAADAAKFGAELRAAAVRRFWSPSDACFVANLPWARAEGGKRFDDRSLATSVIFGQAPRGQLAAAVERLILMGPDTGLSYPANAVWRYWALAKGGHAQVILNDLRTRWTEMDSVRENNTLGEFWKGRKDANDQWSHCPVAPLIMTHHAFAGVIPTAPGYAQCDIRPQPGDLPELDVVTHTVKGPIRVACRGPAGARELAVEVPAGIAARLVLPAGEAVDRPRARGPAPSGTEAFVLTGPARFTARLRRL
jgi:hypothetical protein